MVRGRRLRRLMKHRERCIRRPGRPAGPFGHVVGSETVRRLIANRLLTCATRRMLGGNCYEIRTLEQRSMYDTGQQ